MPHPRFSLRTLLIVVTVFCCWIAYQLNWIRQRHEALSSEKISFPGQARAPALLWVLGERGYGEIAFRRSTKGRLMLEDDAEFERIKRLFPEAYTWTYYKPSPTTH